ncbi:TRAFAC clade GTPase domain-containing protein [Geminocystis sp. NIES-3708]|uniref:TRAFAC clade GTPase domain-containing protein n=1 Tax=Geminocystis sp. NIES-3708 TaxID=1615909 RepID=UPI000833F343|nr:hypothetical protein [Geminocystis sp. NIES-3708]
MSFKIMKIVMLGHSGVGKTTYMASLYGVLQQSVQGFRLKTTANEDHKRLVELAENIRQANYPLGTDQRKDYDFDLRYQGDNVLTFSWSDYRGRALTETQDSEQAKLLLQDLKEADGIMIFCDSFLLNQGKVRNSQIGRMISLINHSLKELEHPLSISILLTKFDLLENITNQLIKPFEGLITTINCSNNILGAFIPVGCGVKQINIPIPLLFILNTAVSNRYHVAQKSLVKSKSEAEEFAKNSQGLGGNINWIVSKITGEESNHEKAINAKAKAELHKKEWELIKATCESLEKYIKKIPLIKNNMTIDKYTEEILAIKSGIISQRIENLDPFAIFD